MLTPEDHAREHIDQALKQAGWRVQDYKSANLRAGKGVVLRNFPLMSGHGLADYLRYVDGKAAGITETKKEGEALIDNFELPIIQLLSNSYWKIFHVSTELDETGNLLPWQRFCRYRQLS